MSDASFMSSALALSETMRGKTGANPTVGCVVVRDGVVIGQAATGAGGRPHAEEQALAQGDVRGAIVYVTLEPCAERSAQGQSCTDLLIAAGVSRVVIAARDPHPLAAGAGIERLRVAGIRVEFGLMEAKARAQNASFFAQWDKA